MLASRCFAHHAAPCLHHSRPPGGNYLRALPQAARAADALLTATRKAYQLAVPRARAGGLNTSATSPHLHCHILSSDACTPPPPLYCRLTRATLRCLLPCPGAKPETRARSREVLYATSDALERAAAKRQRQQGQQPEQERRPPRKQHHAADEAPEQQQQQQEGRQQAPASGKKAKKRRQQEAAEAAAPAATPQQERAQQQVQQQAPAADEAGQQVPASSSKKQRKASRLGPSPAAAAQLQAAARRQRHEPAAEEEEGQRRQGLRHDITEQEQELLAAAVAAVTGGGSVTPGASPSKHKNRVRFSLKRNLVNVIGQPPKPEDVRTPPTSKPKGPALKKHSAFGGPASAPERLLTRAGGGWGGEG